MYKHKECASQKVSSVISTKMENQMIKEMVLLFLRPIALVVGVYVACLAIYTCASERRAACTDEGGAYIRGKCYLNLQK
jgi:hypothetical protein